MSRTLLFSLIVICCGIFMLFMDERLRHPSAGTIAVTIPRSEAGAPLRTIFDGLPEMHIPRSLEPAALPAIGSVTCRQQDSEWIPPGVQSLFRLTSVYASTSCPATECTGTWWNTYDEFCYGSCTGISWKQAQPGGYFNGDRRNGGQYTGKQKCTWNPATPPGSGDCTCEEVICNNGLPGCGTKQCDPQHPYQTGTNGCDQGMRCNSNACCES